MYISGSNRNISFRIGLGASSLLIAAALLLGLLWFLGCGFDAAVAAPNTELHVCTSGPPDCDFDSVQSAVDAANPGDLIKIAAGVYNDIHVSEGITQVVYITKTVMLQGGYILSDWDDPDPETNLTTLDANGQGRVVYISGAITPALEGLRLTGGDATDLGGNIDGRDVGGGVYISQATATISNCEIVSNTASTVRWAHGGGIYLQNSPAILVNNVVQDNLASIPLEGNGGGLYLYHSDATLHGNIIENNTASQSTSTSGSGGGLFLYHSDSTLESNSIQNNIASTSRFGFGGGLYLHYQSNAILNDNLIVYNVASMDFNGSGGGIYLNSESNATLQGNTINENIASEAGVGEGGGVYANQSNAWLENNVIISNTATTDNASYGYGGGLYLNYSGSSLINNQVIGNVASKGTDGWGGGLFLNESAATVLGNTVQSNIANPGGDGSGGGFVIANSSASLESNSIINNFASISGIGRGGGLYISSSANIEFFGNTVHGNIASSEGIGIGGGLAIMESFGTFTGNFITNNTATFNSNATSQGGGMLLADSGPLTFINNFVASNHANDQGSGLWFEGSSFSASSHYLLHNTIADNRGGEQGVYVGEYTTLVFTNTIITGHDTVGITVDSGGDVSMQATLWFDNGSDTSGIGGIFTGTLNVEGDPNFVNPEIWNYHLRVGSAAINAGINAGVSTDIDGHSRPSDIGYDIGADEYYPSQPPVADAGDPQTAHSGTVTLDGSGSSDPDEDVLNYQWNQSGGTPVVLNDPTAVSPTFTAPATIGVLTFTLIVTDTFGESDNDLTTVTIINQPPVADAGESQNAHSGTVTLDGSNSYDPDGDSLSFEWSQTGGVSVVLSDFTAESPTFTTPNSVGVLTFTLVVTDPFGAVNIDITNVTVEEYRIFLPILIR